MTKKSFYFGTSTQNGIVNHISRGVVYQPTTRYTGRETKWFDDSKLLRRKILNK